MYVSCPVIALGGYSKTPSAGATSKRDVGVDTPTPRLPFVQAHRVARAVSESNCVVRVEFLHLVGGQSLGEQTEIGDGTVAIITPLSNDPIK